MPKKEKTKYSQYSHTQSINEVNDNYMIHNEM